MAPLVGCLAPRRAPPAASGGCGRVGSPSAASAARDFPARGRIKREIEHRARWKKQQLPDRLQKSQGSPCHDKGARGGCGRVLLTSTKLPGSLSRRPSDLSRRLLRHEPTGFRWGISSSPWSMEPLRRILCSGFGTIPASCVSSSITAFLHSLWTTSAMAIPEGEASTWPSLSSPRTAPTYRARSSSRTTKELSNLEGKAIGFCGISAQSRHAMAKRIAPVERQLLLLPRRCHGPCHRPTRPWNSGRKAEVPVPMITNLKLAPQWLSDISGKRLTLWALPQTDMSRSRPMAS